MPYARGKIRASSVIEIRSGNPLRFLRREPREILRGFAKDVPLGRTQAGMERSRAGVRGRGYGRGGRKGGGVEKLRHREENIRDSRGTA